MIGALSLLGQTTYDYSYQTSQSTASAGAALGVILIIELLVVLPIIIVSLISMWKLFTKAGKPGWASIIPIYNTIVELEIIGRPVWWIFLMFIPFVNLVISIIIIIDLAKSFGKDTGFAILLLFLPIIGLPMLAFGKSQYVGPAAAAAGAQAGMTPQAAAPYNPQAQTPVMPTQAPAEQPAGQQPPTDVTPPQSPIA